MNVHRNVLTLVFLSCAAFDIQIASATPAPVPREGTREYCDWQYDRCQAETTSSFIECLASGRPVTAIQSYCLRKIFLIRGELADVTERGTGIYQESHIAYSVAECVSAFEGSDSDQLLNLNLSEFRYLRCTGAFNRGNRLCTKAWNECLASLLTGPNEDFVPRLFDGVEGRE